MELKENMINILERYKKLILAHDKTEKRDSYVALLINYIIEKSKMKGISNPLIIKIDLSYDSIKKDNNVLTMGINVSDKARAIKENITEAETLVGLVVDDAALVLTDVGISNELVKVDEILSTMSKRYYRIFTVTGFLNSPFVCNYALLRNINFDFVKVAGIERINNLVKQFYIVDGANSRPTEEAANIFKVLARYMDIDCYNYIDENSFKMPKVNIDESGKKFLNMALENIASIDNKDIENGCRFDEKRVHVIIVNSKPSIIDSYVKKLNNYVSQNNKVKRVLSKTSASYIYLPDYAVVAISDKEDTEEEILIISQENVETLFSLKNYIRSITHINPGGFFTDLGNFMSIYEAAYGANFYNDENKIFIYSKSDKIEKTNFCELEYLLSKDLDFDMSKVKIIFDNYLKLGKIK